MRKVAVVAVVAALLLLSWAAWRGGLFGGMKVRRSLFEAAAGGPLSEVGRGKGFLFEWEVEGPGSAEVVSALAERRPKWVLSPDEAAAERTIDALTDKVLKDLPPSLAEAAKEKAAPVFRVRGKLTAEPRALSLEFAVTAEYGGKTVRRKGSARVEWSAHGMYPVSRLTAEAASALADILREGFGRLLDTDGEVRIER